MECEILQKKEVRLELHFYNWRKNGVQHHKEAFKVGTIPYPLRVKATVVSNVGSIQFIFFNDVILFNWNYIRFFSKFKQTVELSNILPSDINFYIKTSTVKL